MQNSVIERRSALGVAAGVFFALQPMTSLVAADVLGLSAQAGSALRLVLIVTMFAVSLIAALNAQPTGIRARGPLRWAVAYLVLAGCSLAWSEAASRTASAAYWCGTAANFGAAVLLMRTGDRRVMARSVLNGFVVGAMIVAVVAWLMPMQGDLRLGDEEYFNSNTVAYICVFGVLFTQYLMRGRGKGWWWIVLFLSATVMRSLSKTTIMAFAVSEVWLMLRDRSMDRRTKLLMMVGAVSLTVVFSGLFFAYLGLYTSYGNQAETLTGRTGIWAWAFDGALERPLLGHGFDSIWKVAPIFGTFEARHTENELLQQFYAFGVAGVIALVGCYSSLWRELRRRSKVDPGCVVLIAVIVFVAVRGLAEAEPFDLLLPLWMIALLGSVAAPRAEAHKVRQAIVIGEQNVIRL